MSSYENAPATAMLATHCAICARPLLDAKSVEIGMGPDCRKRYGYDIDVSEQSRKEANVVINHLALNHDVDLSECLATLTDLGFTKLVDVLAERRSVVHIEEDGERLNIHSKYDTDFVTSLRAIEGRKWNAEGKFWSVPTTQKRALWQAMRDRFPGQYGYGAKGLFLIP